MGKNAENILKLIEGLNSLNMQKPERLLIKPNSIDIYWLLNETDRVFDTTQLQTVTSNGIKNARSGGFYTTSNDESPTMHIPLIYSPEDSYMPVPKDVLYGISTIVNSFLPKDAPLSLADMATSMAIRRGRTHHNFIVIHERGLFSEKSYIEYTILNGINNPIYDWMKLSIELQPNPQVSIQGNIINYKI